MPMQRIKLVYTGEWPAEGEKYCFKLIDMDTNEPINLVQEIKFEMKAEDMLPTVTVKFIPTAFEFEGPAIMYDMDNKVHHNVPPDHNETKLYEALESLRVQVEGRNQVDGVDIDAAADGLLDKYRSQIQE